MLGEDDEKEIFGLLQLQKKGILKASLSIRICEWGHLDIHSADISDSMSLVGDMLFSLGP